jgi:hypothetical protein
MRLPTRTLEPIRANAKDPKFETMPNSSLYDNLDFANLQISAFNGDPLHLDKFTDNDLKFIFTRTDVNGMTPLHYAWNNRHYKTVSEIYRHLKLKNIDLPPAHYNILSTCYNIIYHASKAYLANLYCICQDNFTQKARSKIDFCSIGF